MASQLRFLIKIGEKLGSEIKYQLPSMITKKSNKTASNRRSRARQSNNTFISPSGEQFKTLNNNLTQKEGLFKLSKRLSKNLLKTSSLAQDNTSVIKSRSQAKELGETFPEPTQTLENKLEDTEECKIPKPQIGTKIKRRLKTREKGRTALLKHLDHPSKSQNKSFNNRPYTRSRRRKILKSQRCKTKDIVQMFQSDTSLIENQIQTSELRNLRNKSFNNLAPQNEGRNRSLGETNGTQKEISSINMSTIAPDYSVTKKRLRNVNNSYGKNKNSFKNVKQRLNMLQQDGSASRITLVKTPTFTRPERIRQLFKLKTPGVKDTKILNTLKEEQQK